MSRAPLFENHSIVGRVDNDLILLDESIEKIAANIYEPFKNEMTATFICLDGEARIKVNMVEYPIEPSRVIIVRFGQTCQISGVSENLRCRVILMSRNFSDGLFSGVEKIGPFYLQMSQHAVIQMDNCANVFNIYYELLYNITQSPRQKYRLEAAKHLTLATFYGYSYEVHNVGEMQIKGGRKGEIYARFVELVRQNYKHERTLNFYADQLCITPKYLSQVVMQVSGKGALSLIEEHVITECRALLSSTDMTIQQIADAMNFPSQSVFGKYFKRVVGVSPKGYRRES